MINVFSYGGGVQSTACLVLAAQGHLPIPTFLFANVGDDSEHPATLNYVHEIAMPYAARHGLEIIELQKIRRNGEPDTILENIHRTNSSILIPVRMANGAPGNRACTGHFKIKVIAKWIREHGATEKEPAQVHLGISLDEWQRMKDSQIRYQKNIYPLIDRRLSRQDCMNIIAHAGLPVPPKSSCWFCPFHRLSVWKEMAKYEPELFAKSVQLEQFINARRAKLGKDEVWLTNRLVPLERAVGELDQGKLFESEPTCDSGYCFM